MGKALNRAVRHKRRKRKIMPDARCSRCGCPIWLALEQQGEETLCYECARAAEGRLEDEGHHLIGWELEPTVTATLPGNAHRVVSDFQLDWPEEVRTNPTRDPLLIAGAVILAIWDVGRALSLYFRPIVDFLLRLWRWLVKMYGEQWFTVLQLGPLWTKPAV